MKQNSGLDSVIPFELSEIYELTFICVKLSKPRRQTDILTSRKHHCNMCLC